MMFVLGIGSAVGLLSAVVTNLMDVFPRRKYWQMSGMCCLFGFLVGLVYVTPGGQWMLNLVDHFAGTFLVFALAILQLVGVFWIYGIENFCWDAEFMLNRKVTIFWRISWFLVTPVFMIVIFIYTMIKLENPTYSGKQFPEAALIAGWIIFSVGVSQTVIWAIWIAMRSNSSAVTALLSPNPQWGPKSLILRKEWQAFKSEKLEKRRIQSNGHSKLRQMVNILLGKYH